MNEGENLTKKPGELSKEEIEANKKRGELLHKILRGPSSQAGDFPDVCIS